MTNAALRRERVCTCRPEIVAANVKPKDGCYLGHECSCPLHWPVKR